MLSLRAAKLRGNPVFVFNSVFIFNWAWIATSLALLAPRNDSAYSWGFAFDFDFDFGFAFLSNGQRSNLRTTMIWLDFTKIFGGCL